MKVLISNPRREILRAGISGLSMAAGTAFRAGVRAARPPRLAAGAESNGKILVVLELSGGNDGLNTLVPYADDAYYKHRPKIWHPQERTARHRRPLRLQSAAWPASSACLKMASSPSSTAAATRTLRFRTSPRWPTGKPPRPTAASNTAGWAAWPMPSRPMRRPTIWSTSTPTSRSRCAAGTTSRWSSTIPINSPAKSSSTKTPVFKSLPIPAR